MSIVLVAIFACLICSAFFSASEIILLSVNKIKLRHNWEEGSKSAEEIYAFIKEPERIISAILVGNNVTNITATALATLYFSRLLIDSDTFGSNIPLITSLVLTPIILIMSEIIPKSIGRRFANEMIFYIYKPLKLLTTVLSPIISLLDGFNSSMLRRFSSEEEIASGDFSHEEFSHWMKKSVSSGLMNSDTEKMVRSTFEFRETLSKEIMVPLMDMATFSIQGMPVTAFLDFARKHRYTRYPVYIDRIDHIIGYINLYEILASYKTSDKNLSAYLRKVAYVPSALPIDKLFLHMQKGREKLVVLVDEYGGCDGMVTMEDIMEEMVGEIAEEHEEFRPEIVEISPGVFEIDASIDLDDLNEELFLNLPKNGFETLAGYLMVQLEKIPARGDNIFKDELHFEVLAMNRLSIEKIRLTRL
ncbi:MAG: HlyC/CorC family transporter [Candidatus Cloacimonetes bacterium]|nr:HlyC/CorC family transporter [Candidatus Cloacimonadota bacterium]